MFRKSLMINKCLYYCIVMLHPNKSTIMQETICLFFTKTLLPVTINRLLNFHIFIFKFRPDKSLLQDTIFLLTHFILYFFHHLLHLTLIIVHLCYLLKLIIDPILLEFNFSIFLPKVKKRTT
jgi:hypothetical protein